MWYTEIINKELEDIYLSLEMIAMNMDFRNGLVPINGKIRYGNFSANLYSAQSTLMSVDLCIGASHFSDAFCLLRKLRDDLMQYLFIINFNQNSRKKEEQENITSDSFIENIISLYNNYLKQFSISKEGQAIKAWILNDLDRENRKVFGALKYKEALVDNKNIEFMHNTYLESIWTNTDRILNDYVHSNGLKYLQDNYSTMDKEPIRNQVINVSKNIFSLFISYLSIIDARALSSSDYLDSLEMGVQPVEGSQYYVMPIITDYMKRNFPGDLVEYIDSNNMFGMIFKV